MKKSVDPTAARRALLSQYLGAWLTSQALSVDDLARAEVRRALTQTLTEDLGSLLGRGVDALAGYMGKRAALAGSALLRQGVKRLFGGHA